MMAVAMSAGCVKLVDPETGVQTWETPPTAPSGMTSAVMSPSGAFVASVVHPGAQIAPNPTQSWQLRDALTGTVLNNIATPDGTVGLRTLESIESGVGCIRYAGCPLFAMLDTLYSLCWIPNALSLVR